MTDSGYGNYWGGSGDASTAGSGQHSSQTQDQDDADDDEGGGRSGRGNTREVQYQPQDEQITQAQQYQTPFLWTDDAAFQLLPSQPNQNDQNDFEYPSRHIQFQSPIQQEPQLDTADDDIAILRVMLAQAEQDSYEDTSIQRQYQIPAPPRTFTSSLEANLPMINRGQPSQSAVDLRQHPPFIGQAVRPMSTPNLPVSIAWPIDSTQSPSISNTSRGIPRMAVSAPPIDPYGAYVAPVPQRFNIPGSIDIPGSLDISGSFDIQGSAPSLPSSSSTSLSLSLSSAPDSSTSIPKVPASPPRRRRRRQSSAAPDEKPACDLCRRRKVKCDRQEPRCGLCARRGVECTTNDQLRRRGPPTNVHRSAMLQAGYIYDRGRRRWREARPEEKVALEAIEAEGGVVEDDVEEEGEENDESLDNSEKDRKMASSSRFTM